METVKMKFRDCFGVEPPRKATILGWEKRAFATSSVKYRSRSERATTRMVTCHVFEASVERSPLKSTRNRSAELNSSFDHEESHES
ncbi:hypothetical protein ANN_02040 [Periplaneta americana]|uniref:Uncharacterized protein n=1 Tax=Periplaneta americana TaxID=6978 RepID=A0ABQ8TVA4_PERAM|nr:hypothetical protein ANN_02040 [Periplaneta americana]